MCQILADQTRRQQSLKRGRDWECSVFADELPVYSAEKSAELLALDQVLNRLSLQDERQIRIVEMTFFAAPEIDDIRTNSGCFARAVKRGWTMARAWLHRG